MPNSIPVRKVMTTYVVSRGVRAPMVFGGSPGMPYPSDPTVVNQIGEVDGLPLKVVWRPSHNFVITVAGFDR
jgi:hypothetical protein